MSEYIILCRNNDTHTAVTYDPPIHGTSVRRYATRTACQRACDALNATRAAEGRQP